MAKRNGLTSTRGPGTQFGEEYYVAYDRWVFGRFIEAGPVTLNLVSEGRVPRGRDVPVPEALRYLPKKPPQRRAA